MLPPMSTSVPPLCAQPPFPNKSNTVSGDFKKFPFENRHCSAERDFTLFAIVIRSRKKVQTPETRSCFPLLNGFTGCLLAICSKHLLEVTLASQIMSLALTFRKLDFRMRK